MHRCFHWEIIDNTTGERNKYSAGKIDKHASPTRELLVSNLRIVLHFFLLERYFCFSFLFFFLSCDRLRNKKLKQLSREQIYDNRTVDHAKCLGLSSSFFIRFKTTGSHKLQYYISSFQHARNVSENKQSNILRKLKV